MYEEELKTLPRDKCFRCPICGVLYPERVCTKDPIKGLICPRGCERSYEQPPYEPPIDTDND